MKKEGDNYMSFLSKIHAAEDKEEPLSTNAFYRKYSQHIDLRHRQSGKGKETLQRIKEEGFKSSGLNTLPVSDGKIFNVIDKKYGVKKNDIVYLVPNDKIDKKT